MKELLSAFSYLGIHQFVSLVFGLVRSKIIAVFLGAFGVGIFSQANNLMELIRQVSSLGINTGFLTLVADYKNHQDRSRLGKTIVTTVTMFALIGLILILLSSLFAETVSTWIFDDPGYVWFIRIVVFTGVLSAEYFTFMTVYQALLKWAEFVKVSVIGYALNLCMALILIFTLGLWGAVLSMLAAQLINLILSVYVLRRSVLPQGFGRLVQYRPELHSLKEIIRYIGPLSTITLVSVLSTISIRSVVVHRLGADTNGIYTVVYATSLAYMGLVRNSFNAFGLPKITASLREPEQIRRVQNDEIRLGLIILAPLLLSLMITRKIWIPILYSSEFLPAASLLVWQFAGDILRMIRISINTSLLPMDRLRFVLVDGLIDWGGWLVLSILLLPSMGITAVPFSYMLVGLFALVIAFVYHRRTTTFRILRYNKLLLAKVCGLLVPGLILVQWGQGVLFTWVIPAALIAVMLLWMPNKNEFQQLRELLRGSIGKYLHKKDR